MGSTRGPPGPPVHEQAVSVAVKLANGVLTSKPFRAVHVQRALARWSTLGGGGDNDVLIHRRVLFSLEKGHLPGQPRLQAEAYACRLYKPRPHGLDKFLCQDAASHHCHHLVEAGKAGAPPSSFTAGRNPWQCSSKPSRAEDRGEASFKVKPAALQVIPSHKPLQRLNQRVQDLSEQRHRIQVAPHGVQQTEHPSHANAHRETCNAIGQQTRAERLDEM